MPKLLSIDINSFYRNGFSNTFIMKHHYENILKGISKIKFVEDPNKIYNLVPYWHSDKEIKTEEQRLKLMPSEITNTIKEIISDKKVIGLLDEFYSLNLDFIDIWDGHEKNLSWHWDGPCQSDLISIIYLNDLVLDNDYGGELELGERDLELNQNWLLNYENIRIIKKIKPTGRNQVWINNANPRFVHRALSLKNNKSKRLLITFGCSIKVRESMKEK